MPSVIKSASDANKFPHHAPLLTLVPSARNHHVNSRVITGAPVAAHEPWRGDDFDERLGEFVMAYERRPQRKCTGSEPGGQKPI